MPITSLDDYLAWFTELTERLGVKQFHLVGNSFGAFTATYYAMRLTDRVRTLTLIGPAATFTKMPQFYIHMFLPKLFHLLLPWLPGRERMMRNASRWMHADLPVDGLWDTLFIELLMYGRMTSQVMPRVYSAQELSGIQAPTLLLLGDRERIYASRDAIDAAKLLMPRIRTEILPEAHHVSAVANPEAVSTSLFNFFQGNSPN
jgi:pimeloyl-ACP methyl ester carboxylesterase